MRTQGAPFAAFVTLSALLASCGGGGGGGPSAIPLATNVFAGWTGTYQAKFDVTGQQLTPTNTFVPITGLLEIADQPGTKLSPTSLLTGVIRKVTWDLLVDGSPSLDEEYDYPYIDGSGNWFQQGHEPASGIVPCTLLAWWHGTMPGPTPTSTVDSRLFLHGPTEAVGDSTWTPPTPLAEPCLYTDAGDGAWEREVVGVEDVTTPFGTYECYRVEEQLLQNSADGFERITSTRWERPELGLVALDTVHELTNTLGVFRRETHAKLVLHTP